MAGGITNALIRSSSRAIGQIYADVTVEENHRDEVIITQHPVENGGIITDHAFKRPSELEIRCGFSDSSAGYDGYVQEQYRGLLALQLARQPFTVYTGKRKYQNMLIRGLSVVTDPHSEFVLMASVALQEIILVSTQTTGGAASGTGTDTAAAGASGNQADPSSTGAVTNSGNVEAQGVGSQAFAGAYGPGSALNPGSFSAAPSVTDQNSGSALGGTLGGSSGFSLSGISPPPVAGFDAGEITFSDPSTGNVVATTPPYNPFATGAFGGT